MKATVFLEKKWRFKFLLLLLFAVFATAFDFGKEKSQISDNLKIITHNSFLQQQIYRYHTLGSYQADKGNYVGARKIYLNLLRLIQQNPSLKEIQIGRVYKSLTACAGRMDDYESSINYGLQALDIYTRTYGEYHSETAKIYNNLGVTYENFEDYEKALAYQTHSLQIKKQTLGDNNKSVAAALENVGVVKRAMSQYAESVTILESALAMKLQNNCAPPEILRTYNNLARSYLLNKNVTKSKIIAKKMLSLSVASSNKKDTWTGIAYQRLSDIYVQQNNYKQGLEKINLSLMAFDFDETNINSAVQLSLLDILNSLESKSKIITKLYQQSNSISDLISLENVTNQMITLLELVRENIDSEASKELKLTQNYNMYEAAFDIEWQLYQKTKDKKYIKSAFIISERAKNISYLESLTHERAEFSANIPSEILENEKKIQNSIATLEDDIFQLKSATSASEIDKSKQLKKSLIEENHKLKDLLQSVEKNYPQYYQVKYNKEFCQIDDIQSNYLKNNQSLVEYFSSKNSLFAFVISRDTFTLYLLSNRVDIDKKIIGLIENIRKFPKIYVTNNADTLLKNKTDFITESFALYNLLVQPFAKELKEKITIVPDKYLGAFPFEVLLSNDVVADDSKWSNFPYFVDNHIISYIFSGQVLKENSLKPIKKNQNTFAGFAPQFNEKTVYLDTTIQYLVPLRHNENEVKSIQQIVGGNIFLKNKASISTFIEQANSTQILHLATHGKANNSYGKFSYLAFQNEKTEKTEFLLVKKLYAQKINSELVVLSACETGLGEVVLGEGIISVARGFLYAGARSAITTIWQISDSKSGDLLQLFYKKLLLGTPKDESLWQAKKEYKATFGNHALLGHPLFWAGFIPIGDMSPLEIQSQSGSEKYFIVALAVIASLLVLLFWKSKK